MHLLPPLLAMEGAQEISVQGLVWLVIYLGGLGLIVWLLIFLIDYIGVPQPFAKVAKVIIMVFSVLILISVILAFMGHPLVHLRD
jgi:hypothetical protein